MYLFHRISRRTNNNSYNKRTEINHHGQGNNSNIRLAPRSKVLHQIKDMTGVDPLSINTDKGKDSHLDLCQVLNTIHQVHLLFLLRRLLDNRSRNNTHIPNHNTQINMDLLLSLAIHNNHHMTNNANRHTQIPNLLVRLRLTFSTTPSTSLCHRPHNIHTPAQASTTFQHLQSHATQNERLF